MGFLKWLFGKRLSKVNNPLSLAGKKAGEVKGNWLNHPFNNPTPESSNEIKKHIHPKTKTSTSNSSIEIEQLIHRTKFSLSSSPSDIEKAWAELEKLPDREAVIEHLMKAFRDP